MANQYCKITSWIEHNKKHKDHEYAKSISNLCLESYLNPSKFNGLTFLYQTDKAHRKKFNDAVFTKASRPLCDEFKRHILPDVFLSCEDFKTKEVGNILGEKYIVESCKNDTVTFKNGMKIQAVENSGDNSFEPLSENLKDVIRIYYIIEGEPNKEKNGVYHITHRKKSKKYSLNMEGGATKRRGRNGKKIIKGGTAQEFEEVYISSNLNNIIKDLNLEHIRNHGGIALYVGLTMLEKELISLKTTKIPTSNIDNSPSPNVDSNSSPIDENNMLSNFEDNVLSSNIEDNAHSSTIENNDLSDSQRAVTGGNEIIIVHIQNLILAQWLINTCPEGIIAYIYICLFILYKSEPTCDSFRDFINSLIINMLTIIKGGSAISVDTGSEPYIDKLTTISSTLGFNKSTATHITEYKVCEYINKLHSSGAEIKADLVSQFFARISGYTTIWGGEFIPNFYGDMRSDITAFGSYLGLWTITLFSLSTEDIDMRGKMEMLDNTFCDIIRTGAISLDNDHIFTKDNLLRFINKSEITAAQDSDELAISVGIATQTEAPPPTADDSNSTTGGMFD
jgi:hypothetical protein